MADTQPAVTAKKARRRWFQFSLRTLLGLTVLVGIGITLLGVWKERVRRREAALARQTQALAEFNRGAALMEQYRYNDAVATFEAVLGLAPDWVPARFNLGLAYYYATAPPEDATAARAAFERVLQSDPDHTHAHYCIGLHYLSREQYHAALEHIRGVYELDPSDPHVAYTYARVLTELGEDDQATTILEKSVADGPGFVSSVYYLARHYKDSGHRKEARRLLDRFSELNSIELASGSYTIKNQYGMRGKYAVMLGTDGLPLMQRRQLLSQRFVFSPKLKYLDRPTVTWHWTGGSVALPGIAAGDVDFDFDLDLCITGLDEQGSPVLYVNNGSGGFTIGPTIATRGVCPCFADVDNDGAPDLWLGRAGPDLLLKNGGLGNFSVADVGDAVSGSDELTTSARLLDLDNDGDLDLFACRLKRSSMPTVGDAESAGSSLYNNNLDGSFTDVAEQNGLALRDTAIASAIYDDFDNDWDMDIILCPADGHQPIAWVNHRAGEYRILNTASTGLAVRDATGVTSADPDRDGDRDLLFFCKNELSLFINQGRFSFQFDQGFSDRFGRLGGTGGQFADMDNDGDLDLVIADARRPDGSRGPLLLANTGDSGRMFEVAGTKPRNVFRGINFAGNASCVVADFTGNGRCDVFLAPVGEKPVLIENVTPGGHWVELDLIGMRGAAGKTLSNASAIGARVEVRSGVLRQQHVVGVPSGPVAMPPLRVHAGLGPNAQVDWLRIRWPDAQLQSELGILADQVLPIGETSHKRSSCPHLFAWDGSQFRFVSDFGGV